MCKGRTTWLQTHCRERPSQRFNLGSTTLPWPQPNKKMLRYKPIAPAPASVLKVSHFCAICLLVALGQLYPPVGDAKFLTQSTVCLIPRCALQESSSLPSLYGTECKSRLDSGPSSALLVSLPRSTRTQKTLSRGLAPLRIHYYSTEGYGEIL